MYKCDDERKKRERLMKKIILVATMLVAMLISGCGNKVTVGYLNGEKVMDAPQIKAIRDESDTKLQEAQTAAAADLTAKPEATDEEKQNMQMEAQRKLMGIQQAYASQMKQKLDSALADIVKAKEIDVVLDSSEENPMVFEGGIDLTEEVLQKLQ